MMATSNSRNMLLYFDIFCWRFISWVYWKIYGVIYEEKPIH